MVGLNYKDDRTKAINWLNTLGNPYSLSLYDGDGMLGLDLGVYGAPESFIIDSEGVIRYHHTGVLPIPIIEQQIRPLIEEFRRER